MELKPGYKHTEVGVIPEEWEVKALGEIATIATGNTPPTSDASNYGDEFLFVGPVDMGENKFITRTEKGLSKKGFAMSRRFPEHSILFVSIGSTIGKCGIATVELTSNQQINAVFPSPAFSANYLFYAICTTAPKIKAQAGEQAVPIVNKTQFSETAVALPPLHEQRAIAEALSDVDSLLDGLDRLIAKKRDLRQAGMQQLLTGQNRLPGFHGEWEEKTLKQVAEITTGVNKPISEMGNGALYVTVQDLYAGTFIRINRLGRIRVSEAEIASKALIVGDIVFGKSSVKREGIGYPSMFAGCNEPVVFSGFAYCARARHGISDATFLFYALRSEKTRRWLIDNSQASALTNINQGIADAIPIRMPPTIHEQIAIATVLADMDAELAAMKQRRTKTRNLKQAMMQELLTGKTRLVKTNKADA